MTDATAPPPDLRARLQAVRLLVFDVDGVLTDGRLLLSATEEAKAFHVRDGLALVLAQQAGLTVAWLSGRASPAVARRARELGIPDDLVIASARNKGPALQSLMRRLELPAEAVAFMGDDLNDLPAFDEAGVRVAVADAAPELKARAHLVTTAAGGHGAVRELVERVLHAQGRWDAAVAAYLNALRAPSVASPQ